MRISGETEALDALQVLAARRREIPLTLVTERPLRKSRKMSKKAKETLRREVLDQVETQLRRRRRRAFRGRVAVDLELRLPRGRYEAEMRSVVKEYLDVLSGSLYGDDAVIDHLTVSCSYADGPARVKARCQPVGLFAASFDRSFRLGPELGLHDPDAHPRTLPWGLRGFDHHDEEVLRYEEGVVAELDRLDAEEEAAFEEDEDADFFPEVSEGSREFADPDLRKRLGAELEDSIGLAIGAKLTHQGFDSCDRPGPPPGWLDEVIAGDLGDVDRLPSEHPGCFLLPPPPEAETGAGGPRWDDAVRSCFRARAGRPWRWASAIFGEPLVLDIAVRAGAAPRHDLDNLAHRVGAAFRGAYPAVGRLGGYRVYRVEGGEAEVCVRVVPAARLALLRRAWDEAQELLLTERAERGRGILV
jgi:Holliday junction resolvase RusA-like endonuclease